MKRRTLLGSAAMTFGGASVLGTGAFTSVKAERSVSVDVVGDADAFLGLRPCPHDDTVEIEQNEDDEGDGGEDDSAVAFPPSHAVVEQNGRIRIDLTGHNNKLANEGITENSVWRFPNALEITNQGTQPVCVDLCIEDSEGDECAVPTVGHVDDEDFAFVHGAPAVVLYTTDDQGNKNKFGQDTDTTESPLFLPRGESECIGFDVRTFVSEEELSNMTLRIRADARTDCGSSSEDGTAGDAGVLSIENAETYGESNGQNGNGNSRIKFDLSASETATLTGLKIRSASSNPGNDRNGDIDKIHCDNGSTIEFDGEDGDISEDHMSEFSVDKKIEMSSDIEVSQDGPVQIRVGKFIGSSGNPGNSNPKNMNNGSVSCVFYYRSDEQGEERSQSIKLTKIPNSAE